MATVTIEGTSLPADTGNDGSYLISGVEEGIYNITAGKDGYISQTKSVEVKANTTVDFMLYEITEALIGIKVDEWWTQDGRNNDRHLRVKLLALADGAPVSVVIIYATLVHEEGTWNFSGTTNGDGEITFGLNNAPYGYYMLTVDQVSHDILNWDRKQPEDSTYTK